METTGTSGWNDRRYFTPKYAFDRIVMNWVGDHKARYYDGFMGGWGNTLTNHIENNISAENRRRAGYRAAIRDAEDIINSLEEGESIKIISHSYGGAYAKGFAKGFIRLCIEA